MRKLLGFDTETWQKDGEHHRAADFRLGVIWDGTEEHVFHTAEAMGLAFYRREWEGAWFFAHNLMYDLQAIWGHELPGHTCVINGQVYFTTIRVRKRDRIVQRKGKPVRVTERRYVHLADTTRHYQGSLAKLGKFVGLEKMFDGLEDFDGLGDDELTERCVQDAKIVHRAAEDLQATYNAIGTSLNYTAGSSALECFRRTAMQREYVKLDDADLIDMNRCYYGGRTEAFQVGKLDAGTYYLADVVSMYPSVMRDLVLPIPSREHVWRTKEPAAWMLERPGGSHVRIKVPESMYPPLPWKHPTTGKLLFPWGELEGWWTHLEINYALSLGCELIEHREAIWFDASERPFRDFVVNLFQVRQKGGMYDLVGKLCLNSTYGKFGQCRPAGTLMSEVEWLEWASENRKEAEALVSSDAVSSYRGNDGEIIAILIQPDEMVFPKHSNQVWAAMITAAARIKLHGLLVRLGGIYCDTDSVLTREPIEDATELGALGLKDVVTGGVILGPKCYQFHHPAEAKSKVTTRIKGVPSRAGWFSPDGVRWWETPNVREHALLGLEVAYLAPMKLIEGMRRDTVPTLLPIAGPMATVDAPREYVWGEAISAKPNLWFPHRKCLKLENDKRHVLPSGRTVPLRVGS